MIIASHLPFTAMITVALLLLALVLITAFDAAAPAARE